MSKLVPDITKSLQWGQEVFIETKCHSETNFLFVSKAPRKVIWKRCERIKEAIHTSFQMNVRPDNGPKRILSAQRCVKIVVAGRLLHGSVAQRLS